MANSTVSGIAIRDSMWPRSKRAWLSVWTLSGDPSDVQMLAYFFADFLGLELSTKACRIGNQRTRGISIKLGSERNYPRYRRTARGVGASGVPRLISKTAVLATAPCRCFGSGR